MKNNTESQNSTFHNITRGHEGGFPPPDSPRASCSQRLSLHLKQKTKVSTAEPLRSLRCNWQQWATENLKLSTEFISLSVWTYLPSPLIRADMFTMLGIGILAGFLLNILIERYLADQRYSKIQPMAILTGLQESSNILSNQVRTDFDILKESLEKLVSMPSTHFYGLQAVAEIEIRLAKLNQITDLLLKSEILLEISDLSLHLSEFLSQNQSQIVIEFSQLATLLGRRVESYAILLQSSKLIIEAETDKQLSISKQFEKYAVGFELLATVVESRWQFLSIEVLKKIEISADIALDVELKSRQIHSSKYDEEFTGFTRAMRRSVTSVLWMIDKLEDSQRVEGFQGLKNSLTPFMKHIALAEEIQISNNKEAINWIKRKIKETEQNKPTQEEINEYFEIQGILRRDE